MEYSSNNTCNSYKCYLTAYFGRYIRILKVLLFESVCSIPRLMAKALGMNHYKLPRAEECHDPR